MKTLPERFWQKSQWHTSTSFGSPATVSSSRPQAHCAVRVVMAASPVSPMLPDGPVGVFGGSLGSRLVEFGVHTGLQNTSIAELQSLWRRIEDHGFSWISIWDHFYAADGTGNPHCLEAVASHAALAATTSRVRCGSLVYS